MAYPSVVSRATRMTAHVGMGVAGTAAAIAILLAVADRSVCRGRVALAARAACEVAEVDGRSPLALAIFLGAGLASAVVGWFVVTRGRGTIGGLLLLFGVSWTLGPAAGAYQLHAVAGAGSWPGAGFAGWVELAAFNNPAVFVPVGLALLLFPTGRTLSRRWSIVARLLAVGGALSLLGVMAEPLRRSRWRDGWGGVVLAISDVIEIPSLPLIALGTLAAFASLVVRLRRSAGKERQQVATFVRGTVVIVPLVAASPAVFTIEWLWPVWALLVGTAAGLVPTMLGVAIVGRGLYGLDRLVNRAVVYGLLTVAIVAAYVTVVTMVGGLAGRDAERLAALAVTAVVAVAFQPLQTRLQRAVDLLLFGHRSDPAAAATEVARRLALADDEESPLSVLAEATAAALRLPYVMVAPIGDEVEPGEVGGPLDPRHADELVRFDLQYRGATVGWLSCLPRQEGRRLDPDDEAVLSLLLPPMAVATHAAALAGALERSRDRLVEAQEAEQTRIRRDLHDTLGPALTGIGLGLGELEERAQSDKRQLERLRVEVTSCIGEIRRIAHDLQPLALTEHGLVGALRVHAERFSALGLRVEVDASDDTPIAGSAVERAAYRIAAEALANVHRHADATECKVRLRIDETVDLEIVDDGRGISSTAGGLGLRSIEERTRELNGRCSVDAVPAGGTRVHVVLPVRS